MTMRSIETSGKTVEDAIKSGLHELRLTSSDVTIDVLDMGSPGLFGMFGRLAKVRLTVKEKDADIDFEMPIFSLDEPTKKQKKPEPKPEPKPAPQPEKKPEPKPAPQPEKKPEPKPEPKPEAKPERKPEPRPAPQSERKPEPRPQPEKRPDARPEKKAESRPERKPRPPREERVTPPAAPAQPTVELPLYSAETATDIERRAYDFLANLTKLMGVNVEIRMRETEDQLSIQMMGDTLGVLIGRRGETLDALQYLTSLQVNKDKNDYTRVSLDTEYYRAKREEALQKLANRMAARARKTGHRVVLEPMNPYERRVMHSALQNNPYVETHSEGDEPYRRVVITLK